MASNSTDNRLNEPVVLLFERSPFGTLDAIVQHDGKAVYFYLNEPKSDQPGRFGTRACWVRNLALGPMVVNDDEMKQGISPMLPRTQCVNREAQPIPDADHLSVVWLEEGNGAALVETAQDHDSQPKTLAVIPPWSGLEGFHGYAAECAVENPLCWPMPDNPNLHQRIERASQFWEQWNNPETDPFSSLQPKLLAAYDKHFGGDPLGHDKIGTQNQQTYFSIDGGKFPPRGLVQYVDLEDIVLATVGMSICPQPAVEIFTDDPSLYRRIELAIRVPKKHFDNERDSNGGLSIETLQRSISGLASYPWSQFTWLGPGHTCGLVGAQSGCESALLVQDQQLANVGSQASEEALNSIALPSFRNDPINLLWLFPVQPQQQRQLQANELTVEQFLESRF